MVSKHIHGAASTGAPACEGRQEGMSLPVCLLESSLVGDLVHFQESDAPPVNAEVSRELREAEVLRPGTYTDMSG